MIFIQDIGGVIHSIIKKDKLLDANDINFFVSNFALVIAPIVSTTLLKGKSIKDI